MMVVQLTVLELRRLMNDVVSTAMFEAGFARGTVMKEKFLTTEEAATLLKVKPSTVLKRRSRGELTGIKKGGRLMFKHSELLRYLEGGCDAQ